MDPITAALADAAQAIDQGNVDDACLDAYGNLNNLLVQKFGADSDVVQAVNMLERTPQTAAANKALQQRVHECHADDDEELLAAAQRLRYLLERRIDINTSSDGNVTAGGDIDDSIITTGDRNSINTSTTNSESTANNLSRVTINNNPTRSGSNLNIVAVVTFGGVVVIAMLVIAMLFLYAMFRTPDDQRAGQGEDDPKITSTSMSMIAPGDTSEPKESTPTAGISTADTITPTPSPASLFTLGETLMDSEDWLGAINAFEQALDTGYGAPEKAWHRVGIAQRRYAEANRQSDPELGKQHYELSLIALTNALDLVSDKPEDGLLSNLYEQRAGVYSELGQPAAAVKDFAMRIELTATPQPMTYFSLASALGANGEWEEALFYFQKEVDTNADPEKKALVYTQMAQIPPKLLGIDPDEAMEQSMGYLNSAIETKSDYLPAYYVRGALHEQRDEPEKACNDYGQYLALAGHNTQFLEFVQDRYTALDCAQYQ